MTLKKGLIEIADSISRGKGNFVVGRNLDVAKNADKNAFCLAVGARSATKLNGGFIVSIGLDREKLMILRGQCDDLLMGDI